MAWLISDYFFQLWSASLKQDAPHTYWHLDIGQTLSKVIEEPEIIHSNLFAII